MLIIKHRAVVEDDWRYIADDAPLPDSGDITISRERWCNNQSMLANYCGGRVGLRLTTADTDDVLATIMAHPWPLIEIYFPTFTDGRGFSLARMIRCHVQYQGELRAVGCFLRDQLAYLARVGFDTFAPEIDWGMSLQQALDAFEEISVSYQVTYV